MPLTPNQKSIYDLLDPLFSSYKVITIRGDCCCGKNYVCKKYLRKVTKHRAGMEHKPLLVHFDICELCRTLDHRMSSHDTVAYLESLTASRKPGQKTYIYIRRIDSVNEVFCEYGAPLRHLFPFVLARWLEDLPSDVKVLITTNSSFRVENTAAWTLELKMTADDMRFLLQREVNKRRLTTEQLEKIVKISKVQVPGHLYEGLRYARTMTSMSQNAGYNFLDYYKEAYLKASGTPVEAQKDIPKPDPESDLIGLEDLLEQIRIGVLRPMELNHPEIPVKRGIVLSGAPGSGKSSIGRWLAHQLGGKLYLIGGEAGVRGPSFICTFEDTIKEASKNGPSVVFVDDVDTLFGNDDTYRAFLTILDGLDSEKRSNVCVIVTCMSLANVPASLVRGGRLEMCLFTRLPGSDSIRKVVEQGFQKIIRILDGKYGNVSFSDETLRWITVKLIGFNFADIRRCIDDVLRILICGSDARGMSEQFEITVRDLFDKQITQIKQQYEHCGKTESTNIDKDSFMPMYN